MKDWFQSALLFWGVGVIAGLCLALAIMDMVAMRGTPPDPAEASWVRVAVALGFVVVLCGIAFWGYAYLVEGDSDDKA